ncbi:MAG: hypothetical protein KC457_20835, partial [Myxococcales bacterium]|nr:hypothetical protein [Myxococcales bacterium]
KPTEAPWSEIHIHEIRVLGVRPRELAAPVDDLQARVGHAFVEGDWAQVLADSQGLTLTPTLRAIRVESLLALGRLDEGRTALAALLAAVDLDAEGSDPAPVYWLLRHRPALYVPLISQLLGDAALPWFHGAWQVALGQHLGDLDVQRELLALPLPYDLPAGASERQLDALVGLLRGRGLVHRRIGDLQAARRDLLAGFELSSRFGDAAELLRTRTDLELELASVEAELGDSAGARDRLKGLLANESSTIYLEDRIRARPELAAVLVDAPASPL